jgi:FlaA1/EpsC-like NDP-sugar epimerase
MVPLFSVIGRTKPLLDKDMLIHEKEISCLVSQSRFLVIGGAGSIGSAVSLEIFRRNPKLLHVVDISENNTVELVRNIRSSAGYGDGEFETFAIDCGSDIFDAFMEQGKGYDYIFNLSALKHVRSEKDPYTLMRMIEVNVLNADRVMERAIKRGARKYFCVSTDKAANPVNMMGASKRIMEMFLMRRSVELPVSAARFANVAFSDGSLLFGFNRRMEQGQPLSAPFDVRRYFITPDESGEICLMSCLLGENRDIFFPKPDHDLSPVTFSEIAVRYLEFRGYEAVRCATEEEARRRVGELVKKKQYPVYFFKSDTTGEKDIEEFYTGGEKLDMDRYIALGVIKNEMTYDILKLRHFQDTIEKFRSTGAWTRPELIDLFNEVIPEFDHKETGKFLDKRM